jgi:hypothetical protein
LLPEKSVLEIVFHVTFSGLATLKFQTLQAQFF